MYSPPLSYSFFEHTHLMITKLLCNILSIFLTIEGIPADMQIDELEDSMYIMHVIYNIHALYTL